MRHLNITVEKQDQLLHLTRGTPQQTTTQAVRAHMLYQHAELELEVWIVSSLSNMERQLITQSLLVYLDRLEDLPAVQTESQAIPRPRRVLIVDDEEFTLDVFQTFLELSGYQVVTTVNSEQAVQMVETEHPDCVLLDVMMPGMDGFTLCKLIRATPSVKNVPIIFCTAYAALDVEDRRKAAGGDLVIMKPFEMNALVDAIDSIFSAPSVIERQAPARHTVKGTTMLGTVRVSLDANATMAVYIVALHHLVTGA